MRVERRFFMQTNSFFYIRSNHTMPLIKNLKLPAGVQTVEINDLGSNLYQNSENSIVLLSLTGQDILRKKENNLIQELLMAPKKTIFLILTPFEFETKTDLQWVCEQLDMLYEHKVNFEALSLDTLLKEKPYLTFDQTFKEIQQVIELIALVAFNAFEG